MSEVIDANELDLDLMQIPESTEIAETKTEDLSPEDREKVEQFMQAIDIKDSQLVLQYGAAAQKNVAEFSEGALRSVKTKDMGEIGSMLSGVVTELKGFSVEEQKGGLFGLFKKGSNQITSLKAKYDKAEVNVNKICKAMEGHQQVLLKDVAMLDKMYDEMIAYFKQLSLYIIAGKNKLEEAKSVELPRLLAKAEETGLQEDSQAARDYASMIERFEKKIYDLELTRNISMQMAI